MPFLLIGLGFRLTCSERYSLGLSFVDVNRVTRFSLLFSADIFSYAPTWVLSIESTGTPLHVGSSGMKLLHFEKSCSHSLPRLIGVIYPHLARYNFVFPSFSYCSLHRLNMVHFLVACLLLFFAAIRSTVWHSTTSICCHVSPWGHICPSNNGSGTFSPTFFSLI